VRESGADAIADAEQRPDQRPGQQPGECRPDTGLPLPGADGTGRAFAGAPASGPGRLGPETRLEPLPAAVQLAGEAAERFPQGEDDPDDGADGD
jgi:hypothetical protein